MTERDPPLTVEAGLQYLEAVSFVAHRDARAVLPALSAFSVDTQLYWLDAARTLFFYDRDAGKAFMHHTAASIACTGTVREWVAQAVSFTQRRGAWKALEAFMAQFDEVYQAWGAGGEAEWYRLGHTWLGRHLDSGVAYFCTSWATLSGGEGIAGVRALLAPAERLFQERRLALGSYIGGAVQVRQLIGDAGLATWARRGADILQAGRQRGEAFFQLQSDESLAILLENTPGLQMREHVRLFQLLAYVWFGEDFPFADSGWRPDYGRPFIETDARGLFVPVVMADHEEAVLAVLHACGHLYFHSYARHCIEALFRQAGMDSPPLDAEQRIEWPSLFARYGEDGVRFRLLFDLCEDLRVDVAIDRIVPGYLHRLHRKAAGQPLPTGAAAAYYRLALESVAGVVAGESASMPDACLVPLLSADATIADAFRIANTLYDAQTLPPVTQAEHEAAFLPGRGPNVTRPIYPREHPQDTDGPGTVHDVKGEPAQQPRPEETRIPPSVTSNDPDLDIPTQDTAGSGGRIGVGIPQPARVYGRGYGHQYGTRGVAYREWDYRDNSYKPDWAWVQVRELEERDPVRATQILAGHATVLTRLRKALERQKPNRRSPLRRQREGDELDLEATIEYVTERRAGRSPRPHVYRRRVMQTHETAALLLADLSTSIMTAAAHGGGRVVDRLRAGMLLFAEALDSVGDACAIAGFASKYRDNVSYYRIKGFETPLSAEIRATIAGLTGRLATRMGAAIRHALTEFDGATASRRLLLILSDGRPADYDDGGDMRYLHEDTRMAVKEALDAGVHPFCVTLDPSGSEYLPSIFGPGHYMILDRVDDLPRRLPEVYLRLRR